MCGRQCAPYGRRTLVSSNEQSEISSETHPISGVFRLRKPFSFLLMLPAWLFAFCCCCCCSSSCCCFCASSCCWASSSCWNFRLPELVSFSSHGSTNSNWLRLCRHQKYAAANRARISKMIPNVDKTPIKIMVPISGHVWRRIFVWFFWLMAARGASSAHVAKFANFLEFFDFFWQQIRYGKKAKNE